MASISVNEKQIKKDAGKSRQISVIHTKKIDSSRIKKAKRRKQKTQNKKNHTENQPRAGTADKNSCTAQDHTQEKSAYKSSVWFLVKKKKEA